MVDGIGSVPPQQARKRLRTWEEQFEELKRYKAKTGNCLVPSNYPEDHTLAIWVRSQRERRQKLSKEKKQALDLISFVWCPLECMWMQHYQALVSFKEEHGHVLGPFNFEQYGALASWVYRQRRMYAQKSLLADREKLLNEIGFVWNVQSHAQEQEWQIMFQTAVGYRAQVKLMGKQCASCSPEMEKKARRWMDAQRDAFASKTLLPHHEFQLKQIGVDFDRHETEEACCLECEIRKRRANFILPTELDAFGKLNPLINSIKGIGDDDCVDQCVKSLEKLIKEEFPKWYPAPMPFNPANGIDRLVHLVLQLDKILVPADKDGYYFLHRCELLLEQYIQKENTPEPTPIRPLLWCPRSDVENILPSRKPPEGQIFVGDETDDDSMATDEADTGEDTMDAVEAFAGMQSTNS